MEFRAFNRDNRFLEITIRDAARIQSRLVSKYAGLYGEFPLNAVEEIFISTVHYNVHENSIFCFN